MIKRGTESTFYIEPEGLCFEYSTTYNRDLIRSDSELSLNDLRIANVTRCEAVFHLLNDWSTSDWGVSVAEEVGELCNMIKKLRCLDQGLNTSKDPQTHEECINEIEKEAADVVIYLDLLTASLGIDLSAAIRRKFNEVSELRDCNIKL